MFITIFIAVVGAGLKNGIKKCHHHCDRLCPVGLDTVLQYGVICRAQRELSVINHLQRQPHGTPWILAMLGALTMTLFSPVKSQLDLKIWHVSLPSSDLV